MALISKSTIAEVNRRLDAVSVINDYVRLEQKSGRWWGRCPFHGGGQEKTPSFKVDPDTKMYYCFGCNKGGSVISFIMEMEKLSYPEAIKNLASKTGIEIQYDDTISGEEIAKSNSIKDELYELYRRVAKTFLYFLNENQEGQNALRYIRDRGISPEIIGIFKLGYAPARRDFLHKFLKEKGYSDEFLEKSGLFSANYKTIPLFSGRIIFPISDRQGRIVAFGGRAIPDIFQNETIGEKQKEPPKYINSPETEVYKKGQTLFAIDQAKPEMRKTKTVYLAEGYIDVLALHQVGITNSVAPLGTAFTDEQAAWLRAWVERVILIFDTDEAGRKAAFKAIMTCRKNGISCFVVNLDEGLRQIDVKNADSNEKVKDPADILLKFGSDVLKKVLKSTINDFEYLISHAKVQYAAEEGNVNKAAEFLFPFLESLNSEVDRDDTISRIADILKIDKAAVRKDYSGWKTRTDRSFSRNSYERRQSFKEQEIKEDSQISKIQIRRNDELGLLTIVAVNMELYTDFRTALEIKEIDDRAAKEIFIALEECFVHDENGIDSLLSRIKDENLRNYVTEKGTSGEYKGSFARQLMEDGIKRIRIKRFTKRLLDINSEMREIERSNEKTELIDELLEEKQIIDHKIRELNGR
ncbi:MAG: DNA primase [Treponema sp.]|nr:DNA primase [Treponema sp.]